MNFSDIHIHALYNCDDGADSPEKMYKMIDASYEDGVRYMCLTPHYNPGYFGENSEKVQSSYDMLLKYAGEKYPDLHIALGNELRYNLGCEEWLKNGLCRSMDNTKYVLVDFFDNDSKETISKGLDRILNAGYIPILAHAERYAKIRGDVDFLRKQRNKGVLIQIDARSVLGDFGFFERSFSKKILINYLADFVSSDAHGMKRRPPGICGVYEYIEKRQGKDYAEAVCSKNALHMIFGL